jgi:excisionase family DNA binding protein
MDEPIGKGMQSTRESAERLPFRLLTVSAVARMLGVHPSRVRALIADGELRSVRLGSRGWHRIPIREVERLIAGEQDS